MEAVEHAFVVTQSAFVFVFYKDPARKVHFTLLNFCTLLQ